MRNEVSIKLFLSIIIFTTILLTLATVGSTTFAAFFEKNLFAEGTMIGPINVSNLSKKEAKVKVTEDVEHWKNTGKLKLIYGNSSQSISKNGVYQFQIDQTINKAISKNNNSLYATINMNSIKKNIELVSNKEYKNFKVEDIKNKLLQSAMTLQKSAPELDLVNFITVNEHKIVSKAMISNISKNTEITSFIDKVNAITLPPFQSFSFLDFIAKYDKNTFSNQTLSIIATGIYQTILPTNFQILERHISDRLPLYAQLGFEAAIEEGKEDFIIYNSNPYPYKLLFAVKDKDLLVELEGAELFQTYTISLENEETIAPRTIRQYDVTLPIGQSIIKSAGEKAKSVTVVRTTEVNGEILSKETISEDYYRPLYRIELDSLAPVLPSNPLVSGDNTLNQAGSIEPSNPDKSSKNQDQNETSVDTTKVNQSNPGSDTNANKSIWETPEVTK